MTRSTHILNAASNLLGIALVIITGLHVTRIARETLADEVAWGAAVFLSLSCLLSYAALRAAPRRTRVEDIADIVFILGLLCLIASVVVLALWKAH